MKITKRVLHWINLGNYEHIEVSAEVTLDSDTDFDRTPSDDEIISYLDDLVANAMKDELNAARNLTTSDDSYIHELEIPKKGS